MAGRKTVEAATAEARAVIAGLWRLAVDAEASTHSEDAEDTIGEIRARTEAAIPALAAPGVAEALDRAEDEDDEAGAIRAIAGALAGPMAAPEAEKEATRLAAKHAKPLYGHAGD